MSKGNLNVSCPKFKCSKNIRNFCLFVLFYGCLTSCEQGSSKDNPELPPKQNVNKANLEVDSLKYSMNRLSEKGYCDVSLLDSSIWFDLKYFGSDNFMKKRLYQTLNRPFVQCDVAYRLIKCSQYLRSIDTSLHLLIYDAVRPLDVQWKMWHAMDSLPPTERIKYVSNPSHKSLHNYGAAVDLTICRSDRSPLDMGAGFDDFRKIAYPSLETHFLKTKELSSAQYQNRVLLRKVMLVGDFSVLPSEWWHFNACSRSSAQSKYQLMEKEPITEQ